MITHVTYSFLSLLPVVESLATRGHRLQDTSHQRQNKIYAPDIQIKVEVEDITHRIQTAFVDDRYLILAQGECKRMSVHVLNSGKQPIHELWMIAGSDDEIWVDTNESGVTGIYQLLLLQC